MNYQEKYFKYKNKYLQLKNIQLGQRYKELSEKVNSSLFKGGASIDPGTSAGGGGHSSEGTINSFSGSTTTGSTMHINTKLHEPTIRNIILLKDKSIYNINQIDSFFLERINGYPDNFGGKILFYHPIIQYLDYWVGSFERKNDSYYLAFGNIIQFVENGLINPHLLIKQALYQLILNILKENDKRPALYDNFINFLINQRPDLYNTLIKELEIIYNYGFNPEKNMPNLANFDNGITQETVSDTAKKIYDKLTSKGLDQWLQMMEELNLLNKLDINFEPTTSIMAGFLDVYKEK